jgi:hypothetical protein
MPNALREFSCGFFQPEKAHKSVLLERFFQPEKAHKSVLLERFFQPEKAHKSLLGHMGGPNSVRTSQKRTHDREHGKYSAAPWLAGAKMTFTVEMY